MRDIITNLPDKNEQAKIDYKKFKKYIIDNNLQPIFIEQGGINILDFNFYFEKKPVFIFGNESHGIDKKLLNYCKDIKGFNIISIPQNGPLRSLNVCNSASIFLWKYYEKVILKN